MQTVFINILNVSITASFIVLAVLAFRLLLRRAPKYIHVLLWGLVAVRLLLPINVESELSLIPSKQTIPEEITTEKYPTIDSGIDFVDDVVNPFLSETMIADETQSANPIQILLEVLGFVWIVGVVLMLGYLAFSYFRLRYRMREAVWVKGRVYACDRAVTPFILGTFNPRIYVPSDLSVDDYSAVVAHEEAHISRLDHFWKPFSYLVLTVYWFNPFIWLAYFMLTKDIELACDEKVMSKCHSEDMVKYSEALLRSERKIGIGVCPLAFGEVGVKRRVKAILEYKKPTFVLMAVTVVAFFFVAVSFLTYPKTYAREPETGIYYCENVVASSYLLSSFPKKGDIPIVAFTENGTMLAMTEDVSEGAYKAVGAVYSTYIGKKEFEGKFLEPMSWREGYDASSLYSEITRICRVSPTADSPIQGEFFLLHTDKGVVYLAPLTPNENIYALYKLIRNEPLPTFLYTARFDSSEQSEAQSLILNTQEQLASLTFGAKTNYVASGRYTIEDNIRSFTTSDTFKLKFAFIISGGTLSFLENRSDLKDFHSLMEGGESFARQYTINVVGSSAFFDYDKDGVTELISVTYNPEDETAYTMLIKDGKMIYSGYYDLGEYSHITMVTELKRVVLVCSKDDEQMTVDKFEVKIEDGKPVFSPI